MKKYEKYRCIRINKKVVFFRERKKDRPKKKHDKEIVLLLATLIKPILDTLNDR